MAKRAKNDLAEIALLAAVLIALAWTGKHLYEPLKNSKPSGKFLGILGIICMCEAILYLTMPSGAMLLNSGFLPDSWTKALGDSNIWTSVGFGVAAAALYFGGQSRKKPWEPSGQELLSILRSSSPKLVANAIARIQGNFDKGEVGDDLVENEPVRKLDEPLATAGIVLDEPARLRLVVELIKLAFQSSFEAALEDGRVTAEERAILQKYSDALPEAFPPDGIDQLIQQMEARHAVREGRIPVIENPEILMKYKGEQCHWVSRDVELSFEKTESLGYRGASVGTWINVAGQPVRVGAHGGNIRHQTKVKRYDLGELFLTSHRLVFTGKTKSKTVLLSSIVRIETDDHLPILEVTVEGSSSKKLFFTTTDAEVLRMAIDNLREGTDFEWGSRYVQGYLRKQPSATRRSIVNILNEVSELAEIRFSQEKGGTIRVISNIDTEWVVWVQVSPDDPGIIHWIFNADAVEDVTIDGKKSTYLKQMQKWDCPSIEKTHPLWDDLLNCRTSTDTSDESLRVLTGYLAWFLSEAPLLGEQ